ncbi:uncharacterized protein (DUF924 family) [Litorimonas taeanensis]|uniref:Uncharacterized protein (DUF924 family) n=1 Tax=Litorimonas taeanensis TaxID=568099 RepID=A0A420WCZ4_9PROT|nr:DUF924 family protein [Litorimonas taeanensis]RKQ68825.1 uncharacterized protein (DUF924 family) [Litorimonas taeanensis]
MNNPSSVLKFWFEEIDSKLWFKATDAFDGLIRRRFESAAMTEASALMKHATHQWEGSPDSALALVILLDQFPRNMYRGTRGAFVWDDLALGVAQRCVDKTWDLKVPQARRAFIYMPFMHSEDIGMQDQCVRLCDARLDDANTLFHAKAHRKLIREFGRFPHRNAALGRESTPEENAFLANGGYAP